MQFGAWPRATGWGQGARSEALACWQRGGRSLLGQVGDTGSGLRRGEWRGGGACGEWGRGALGMGRWRLGSSKSARQIPSRRGGNQGCRYQGGGAELSWTSPPSLPPPVWVLSQVPQEAGSRPRWPLPAPWPWTGPIPVTQHQPHQAQSPLGAAGSPRVSGPAWSMDTCAVCPPHAS